MKLHPDCHVVFGKAFYSAPHGLIGERLWLRARGGAVQLALFHEHKLVATHACAMRSGQRVSTSAHFPPEKLRYFMEHPSWCNTATRATDLVRVLDSQGIAKAVLAGHSRAGEELTWIATHHPERVEKLVLLDISTKDDLTSELRKDLPFPTPRPPNPADLASRATVAAAIARSAGGPCPEHESDETVELEPKTGRYLRDHKRPDAMAQITANATKVDFAAIRAPVLYLHTGERPPPRVEDYRDFAQLTPLQQEKRRAMHPRIIQRIDETRHMPNWKTVQLEHADHFNRANVLHEMKAFLGM